MCHAPTSVPRPVPTLLSSVPEPYQEPGLFAAPSAQLFTYLAHCILSTYMAKVSAPGFGLHGNRSWPCSWKRWLQEPCRLACIYVFQRQKWLRWFVSWELLMESAKLGMCQLFNFHCYLQKWSFELRKNVPSAYPCDNAWFSSQAYQPLAWHVN